MKTAISLPDDVFREAEKLARKQRKSRSQLYKDAMVAYLALHCEDAITESWNRMLSDPEAADPELDAFVAEAARQTLKNSEW